MFARVLFRFPPSFSISRCFVHFVCRVVPFSPTGQLEPLHGAGVRARRGDVLPPQEDRQVQVRKAASCSSELGRCNSSKQTNNGWEEHAQPSFLHADNLTPIFEFFLACLSRSRFTSTDAWIPCHVHKTKLCMRGFLPHLLPSYNCSCTLT